MIRRMMTFILIFFCLLCLPAILQAGLPLKADLVAQELSTSGAKDRGALKKELMDLEIELKPLVEAFHKVAELVGPSVVSISTERGGERMDVPPGPRGRDFGPHERFDPHYGFDFPRRGEGSGMIIDDRGHILTNLHVIEGYEGGSITVSTADGKIYDARVVGLDSKTDLAVLKIEATGLQPVEFGGPPEVRVGDWVIAIGSPFGYQQTVSAGIISAVGRKGVIPFPKPFSYEDFIQTDAAINPGNSGGPLVNLRGEVIGICTAIATRTGGFQGVGFAISAGIAREVIQELVEKGRVVRGYLGVGIRDIDDELARALGLDNELTLLQEYGLSSHEGAFVSEVWEDTPASKAGLRPGDVIVAVDKEKVANSSSLQRYIRHSKVESVVNLVIVRDKATLTMPVKVEEQPEDLGERKFVSIAQKGAPEDVGLGLTLQELTPEIARSLGYEGEKGLVVTGVEAGSPADKAGLEPGDLILQLGRRPVKTPVEFRQALKEVEKEGGTVALLLKAKGFLSIKP